MTARPMSETHSIERETDVAHGVPHLQLEPIAAVLDAIPKRRELEPGTAPQPLRPIRTAVVGLGRAGIAHSAVLSAIPHCTLVGLVDSRSSARRNVRGMGYAAKSFDSIETLLSKAHPEALIVCVPEEHKAGIVERALKGGAAVLVDRPLARSWVEAADIVHHARERDLPLTCGHALAFHPVFALAHDVLAIGALGSVQQVRASMYMSRVFSPAQQRAYSAHAAAGGVLAQEACDLLFLLVWYFGAPVSARATFNPIYGRLEDEMHGMLTLASGTEIGFDTSWSMPGYPRPATVIELEGTKGRLLASEDALELDLHEPCEGFPAGHTRLVQAEMPQLARFEFDGEALYLQDASFLAWATGASAPATSSDMCMDVLRVVDALYASAREEGKTFEVFP
jgi:predicted dehydrogenase